MLALLSLGFMIGIAHAFEADHLAAVSALISKQSRKRDMMRHGAIWGLGHTVTLFLVGGAVLLTGVSIGDRLAIGLEGLVGVMLVFLGAHVLYRLHRDRVHFHQHSHADGTTHLHLHSHATETRPHRPEVHRHAHPDRTALRVLAVGVMHGLAGSAALVLVAAATMASPWVGMIYIALFGVGSLIGMAMMSFVIAIPLSFTARGLTRLNTALQLVIGLLTTGLGLATILDTGRHLLG
jgi:sulfite exporter TauE/SafE